MGMSGYRNGFMQVLYHRSICSQPLARRSQFCPWPNRCQAQGLLDLGLYLDYM